MPFIPVPDTLLVEAIFEYDNQIVENTTYWQNSAGWDAGSVTTWLGQVRTIIEGDLLPLLSAGIKLVRVVGTLLDAVDALSLTVLATPENGGSDASGNLPGNVTYTVSFKTAGRGRSNRGRNYIPGLALTAKSGTNNVNPTFRTGVLDFYTTLRASALSDGIDMVVVSRYSGIDSDGKPIPRVTGVTSSVTSIDTADGVLDSQRRRLPGRGQ